MYDDLTYPPDSGLPRSKPKEGSPRRPPACRPRSLDASGSPEPARHRFLPAFGLPDRGAIMKPALTSFSLRYRSEPAYRASRDGAGGWPPGRCSASWSWSGGAIGVGVLEVRRPVGAKSKRRRWSATVVVGPFVHEIVERGDVQSSNNVEVRCEVQLRNQATGHRDSRNRSRRHARPGRRLPRSARRLDAAKRPDAATDRLQRQRGGVDSGADRGRDGRADAQRIRVGHVQARRRADAKRHLRRRRESPPGRRVSTSTASRLASKGYVTPIQLEADEFAVEKAQKELDVAKTKLRVLDEFTKLKMLKQLEAADPHGQGASSKRPAKTTRSSSSRLQKIKEQIAKCIISAPQRRAGRVCQRSRGPRRRRRRADRRGPHGPRTADRSSACRTRSRCRCWRRSTSRGSTVCQPGHAGPREDRRPARPGARRPRANGSASTPMQQFTATRRTSRNTRRTIEIHRPAGRIAARHDGAGRRDRRRAVATRLQVPVQAVFERDGRLLLPYVHSARRNARPSKCKSGPTNDKFVVVEAGLTEGEQVVMTSASVSRRGGLPTLAPEGAQRAVPRAAERATGAARSRETRRRTQGRAARQAPTRNQRNVAPHESKSATRRPRPAAPQRATSQ